MVLWCSGGRGTTAVLRDSGDEEKEKGRLRSAVLQQTEEKAHSQTHADSKTDQEHNKRTVAPPRDREEFFSCS
ncbi:hypothetical protein TYRP_019038 [Tyrophagus putrescentiae]|nr:hypothetical protein TYRP_019038 [Tyrophagus putrescentiae]